ncbi:13171_t:CDS:2 [Cetraspora pellucida]|uniref:13171_t:CDS:1 n=1 Tax=Cetraspora pellucida TaxID=1433469 RepID=A0A9N9F230_9GLOM|nr:13171_t:CDS:2 [Cetraspora pellucida]
MYRILLDLIPLHERHTEIILANTIYNIINDFDFGEKIISVITDNALNMDMFEHEFAYAVTLLELIYHATNLSSSSYPTFGDLHMVFPIIANTINNIWNDNNILQQVAQKMKKKLDKYWNKLKTTFNKAVILDTNNKLMSFDNEGKRSETSRDYFRKKYSVSINHDDILKEYLDLSVEEINILDY